MNVILASGNSFPAALSASLLSEKLNASILLVNSNVNESSDAFNYIGSHLSNTGTVYIIGGTDRYDTNTRIVNDVNAHQGTPVFIASGENYPDALSIASFSGSKQYPALLVGADYLPDQTKNYHQRQIIHTHRALLVQEKH